MRLSGLALASTGNLNQPLHNIAVVLFNMPKHRNPAAKFRNTIGTSDNPGKPPASIFPFDRCDMQLNFANRTGAQD